MNLAAFETARRADPRQPSVLTWYVAWTADEARHAVLGCLLYDLRVPALLCTEIRDIRLFAPRIPLEVVLNPVAAIREPIEGYGWLECLQALETWALGWGEVER